MSKNLTRKGLALGAVVALGSSLFAGTPANAATSISLDTAFGTSGATQNALLGEYFTVAYSAVAGVNAENVKLYVEGVTGANLVATSRALVDLTTSGAGGSYTAALAEATVLNNDRSKLVATDNAAKIATVIPVAYVAGQYIQVGLSLGAGVTDTTTIKVTPFIDNGIIDNKPGAGEMTGTPMSITFHKLSTVTATPTLGAVSTGSAVKATVALNNGINLEQLRLQTAGAPVDASKIGVKFLYNGVAQAETAVRWNTTDKVFTASGENAVQGKIYGVTGVVDGVDSVSGTTGTSSATEIQTTGALSATGPQYHAADTQAPGTTTQVIRAGSGTFTAEISVLTVAATKLISGQTISFTIHEAGDNTLDSGASITAGGKTLTNSSTSSRQSITVTAVTGADGKAALPITYAGIKQDNTFRIFASYTVASSGALETKPASSTTANTGGFLITGEDDMAVALVNEDKSANALAVTRIAKGVSASLPFTLVDQFGMTPTGTFRATVTNGGNASITSPVAVSAGKLTVSVTDNSVADNNAGYAVTAQIQKLGSNGVTYTDISGLTGSYQISVGAVTTGSAITLGALTTATPTALNNTLRVGNSDLHQGTVSLTTFTNEIAAGSVVTNSTGAAVAGAKVTFSAPGVLFRATNVTALGSITVTANENGVLPAIGYTTNTAGKTTITATSGAATKTADITVAALTSGTTQSTWTVTAPTYIMPGQSLKVSAVLKNRFGTLIDTSGAAGRVSVSYTGPGFVTAALPTATDADGAVSFTVLLGAADTGNATIKFTYSTADGTSAATSADDVVAQAIVALGAAPAPSATARVVGSTKRFFVGVEGNTLGRSVVVKVAGKTFKTLKGSTAKKSYAVAAPKGSHKVTVFVGGKLIATRTISVK